MKIITKNLLYLSLNISRLQTSETETESTVHEEKRWVNRVLQPYLLIQKED